MTEGGRTDAGVLRPQLASQKARPLILIEAAVMVAVMMMKWGETAIHSGGAVHRCAQPSLPSVYCG